MYIGTITVVPKFQKVSLLLFKSEVLADPQGAVQTHTIPCHEGPVITIIKAIKNILNQEISPEAPWWRVLYNTAGNTGTDCVFLQRAACAHWAAVRDKRQQWHRAGAADECAEWILKPKPISFWPRFLCVFSVEGERVLKSSFLSLKSLYGTLTGKWPSLCFSEPVVLEIADFTNSEAKSGLRAAMLSCQLFFLTCSCGSGDWAEGRKPVPKA